MIENTLNTAIEIEGLIRIIRDGNASSESLALLKEKIASLNKAIESISLPESKISEPDDILLSIDDDPEPELPQQEPGGSFLRKDHKEQQEPGGSFLRKDHQNPQDSLKSLFSLNDRFLFSRELFAGDMKMFDSTLKFIEGIRNFSDVEDYFYGDLEWDPENPVVASYLDILRPHFAD